MRIKWQSAIFIWHLIFFTALELSAWAQSGATVQGNWLGELDAGAVKLKLVLHVTSAADGQWRATLDSPDQGANGLKVDSLTVEGAAVKFTMATLGAMFEGALKGDELAGTFKQGGANLPLVFKRATAADLAPPKRPQTPQSPFPYVAEDVTYDNPAAQIKLAGTLTLPPATTPVPAVILVSGSGPQNRNEELMGHQPFWVLADHLTRAGIAVLRVDDRGVGKSTGSFATATSEDFASDVLAGIAYLKTRKELDAKKLGVIGHSEGGLIAPLCAAKSPDVAFIVMMAGPGVTGEEILYEQAALLARASGANENAITQNRKIQEKIFAILKTEKDPAAADKKLAEMITAEAAAAPAAQKKALEATLNAQIKAVNSPWFRLFLTFDPRPVLQQVKVPVLALNGELDLQVPPQQNLPEIAKALTAGGNKNFKTVTLPKLNHLFQTAQTGAVSEYSKIEETIAPAALTLMTEWIANQTGLANKPR